MSSTSLSMHHSLRYPLSIEMCKLVDQVKIL
jgi:hypothetical protein